MPPEKSSEHFFIIFFRIHFLQLCSDVWHSILTPQQREALADLHLTRCSVEREAKTVTENGKTKAIKDEFGFVEYTDEIKFDDEGNPLWCVLPLDLEVFSWNVSRYGLWLTPLEQLFESMSQKTEAA